MNKATLLVTADTFYQPYGATNPTFTVTYSNFVNGQTLATKRCCRRAVFEYFGDHKYSGKLE